MDRRAGPRAPQHLSHQSARSRQVAAENCSGIRPFERPSASQQMQKTHSNWPHSPLRTTPPRLFPHPVSGSATRRFANNGHDEAAVGCAMDSAVVARVTQRKRRHPDRPLNRQNRLSADRRSQLRGISPTSASSGYVRNPPNTPKMTTFATAHSRKTPTTERRREHALCARRPGFDTQGVRQRPQASPKPQVGVGNRRQRTHIVDEIHRP